MIVILLLVAAISGGGIAVYKFILAPKGRPRPKQLLPPTEEKKGEEAVKTEGGARHLPPQEELKQEGESAPATTAEGQAQVAVLSLKEFIVNLNDPIGRRYLPKTEIKLELNMKAAAAKIQGDELILSRLRDIIFLILSSKSYEDLKGITGKLTLKEEIVAKSNEVLSPVFGKNIVSNCYFTDFVVQ